MTAAIRLTPDAEQFQIHAIARDSSARQRLIHQQTGVRASKRARSRRDVSSPGNWWESLSQSPQPDEFQQRLRALARSCPSCRRQLQRHSHLYDGAPGNITGSETQTRYKTLTARQRGQAVEPDVALVALRDRRSTANVDFPHPEVNQRNKFAIPIHTDILQASTASSLS